MGRRSKATSALGAGRPVVAIWSASLLHKKYWRPPGGDHRRPTLLFSAVVVEFLTLGVLGVLGVLVVCVFKCGILAIRGRRSMTRQLLIFLGASARPTWKRSLEGFLEWVMEGPLRGNMPKNSWKWRKIVPRPSKIEPWGLQNRAWSPPRRYFSKTFNLRRLPRSTVQKVLKPKWPTWLQLGGPRPSKIEAETRKNRC